VVHRAYNSQKLHTAKPSIQASANLSMEIVILLATFSILVVSLAFVLYTQAERRIPSRLKTHQAPRSREGLICVYAGDAYEDTEGVE
jgi:hypothetical protein